MEEQATEFSNYEHHAKCRFCNGYVNKNNCQTYFDIHVWWRVYYKKYQILVEILIK